VRKNKTESSDVTARIISLNEFGDLRIRFNKQMLTNVNMTFLNSTISSLKLPRKLEEKSNHSDYVD
jgi:hypothetical protein